MDNLSITNCSLGLELGDDSKFRSFEQTFCGGITLRGLNHRPYLLLDYVHLRPLGIVQGPAPSLLVEFQGSLLLQAVPQE